jgi:hypothetical protein
MAIAGDKQVVAHPMKFPTIRGEEYPAAEPHVFRVSGKGVTYKGLLTLGQQQFEECLPCVQSH